MKSTLCYRVHCACRRGCSAQTNRLRCIVREHTVATLSQPSSWRSSIVLCFGPNTRQVRSRWVTGFASLSHVSPFRMLAKIFFNADRRLLRYFWSISTIPRTLSRIVTEGMLEISNGPSVCRACTAIRRDKGVCQGPSVITCRSLSRSY